MKITRTNDDVTISLKYEEFKFIDSIMRKINYAANKGFEENEKELAKKLWRQPVYYN